MHVYIASHYLIVCDIFSHRRLYLIRIYRGKIPLLQDMTYQFFLIIWNIKSSLIYMNKERLLEYK